MESNIIIGILGCDGFIGKNLCEYFNDKYVIIPINKQTYDTYKNINYDYFINCNGNSKRYIAEQNPLLDFDLNVNSVYRTIFDFKIKNYIYISSIEVLKNPISKYGFHKSLAESIIKKYFKNYYILRCSNIIGKYMNKGIFYDILNDIPLRLTKDSRLQAISMNELCQFVNNLISNSPCNKEWTLAGINNEKIEDIAKILNKEIKFIDTPHYEVHEFPINNFNYPFKTTKEYIEEWVKCQK